MLLLLRKNIAVAFGFLLPFLTVTTLYWLISRSRLNLPFLLLQMLWMWVAISSVISLGEAIEDKNGGYHLLRQLPLKLSEIVASKFLLVVCTVLLMVAYNALIFSLFASDPTRLALAIRLVLAGAMAFLIIAGAIYAAVYRFGLSNMVKVFWFIVLILLAGFIVMVEILVGGLGDRINHYKEIFLTLSPWLWILAAMFTGSSFYGFYCLSLRNLRNREF